MSTAARIKTPVVLPEVTEQHRRAAFAAMAWVGWTYERAMADDTRRRVVEARAHQLRKADWLASRRQVLRPALPMSQAMRLQNGMYRSARQDLKRAAGGDFED